jgi:hypothetical protein
MLEAAVHDRNVNIKQMTRRMGISRGTYYNHIQNPELPLEQLAKYGKVIGHDFSQQLPEMKRLVLEESEGVYKTPETIEEAIVQRDYWREQYYKQVKEYNELAKKHLLLIGGKSSRAEPLS